LSPNDEFVFAQHQADPGADCGGMHDRQSRLGTFRSRPAGLRFSQFDKTNTYGYDFCVDEHR
jgi:hypothetical protein